MASNKKDVRMCVGCRQHADKSELVRFVKSKDGSIVIDRTKKADGRGVWAHNSDECIRKIKKKRLLNTYFHQNVSDEIFDELYD